MAYTIWRYDPTTETTTAEDYTTYTGAFIRLTLLLDNEVMAYLEIQEGN